MNSCFLTLSCLLLRWRALIIIVIIIYVCHWIYGRAYVAFDMWLLLNFTSSTVSLTIMFWLLVLQLNLWFDKSRYNFWSWNTNLPCMVLNFNFLRLKVSLLDTFLLFIRRFFTDADRWAICYLEYAALIFLSKNSKVLIMVIFNIDSLQQLFLPINNLTLFLLLALNPLNLSLNFLMGLSKHAFWILRCD